VCEWWWLVGCSGRLAKRLRRIKSLRSEFEWLATLLFRELVSMGRIIFGSLRLEDRHLQYGLIT